MLKDKIIELRKEGLTINEIVANLGCAKGTVSYHINKITLDDLGNSTLLNGISFDTINLIKEMRLSFKSYGEILEVIDITEDKLIKICRALHLNKPKHNINGLDKDEILKKYLEIKSLKKVARFFHTTFDTIRKYIPDDKIIQKQRNKTKSKSVIDWRKNVKRKLVEYKGGCCNKCGYNKSINALHFHHLNPNEKDFTIGGSSYSFEKLKLEADKCILVCANCHSEIHDGSLIIK